MFIELQKEKNVCLLFPLICKLFVMLCYKLCYGSFYYSNNNKDKVSLGVHGLCPRNLLYVFKDTKFY